jgi:MFS family permease
MVPMLKFVFVISYVLLAAWVGAFADSMPKGRVMFITNTIKIGGCLLMLLYAFLTPPGIPAYYTVLAAYAIVGFGAAAYSPAKYGILTELLPPQQLVKANGWIEGTTVGSIILGTVLGGALVSGAVSAQLLRIDLPVVDTFVDSAPEAAIVVIAAFYGIAAIFNLYIPDTGVDHRIPSRNVAFLIREFSHCVSLLWRDRLGQISLATTTLFWGAGATLQFIVLKWAEISLDMNLSQAAILQAVVAVGIAIGAVVAATKVTLRQSPSILPVGVAMGVIVMVLALYDRSIAPQGAFEIAVGARVLVVPFYVMLACAILMLVGGLAGFFVVPMNALLQHRGHVLMGAGHSIAVQNFNENLSILAMLAGYAGMIRADLSIKAVILIFGLFVSGSMLLVLMRYRSNQAQQDSLHLIGMEKPH